MLTKTHTRTHALTQSARETRLTKSTHTPLQPNETAVLTRRAVFVWIFIAPGRRDVGSVKWRRLVVGSTRSQCAHSLSLVPVALSVQQLQKVVLRGVRCRLLCFSLEPELNALHWLGFPTHTLPCARGALVIVPAPHSISLTFFCARVDVSLCILFQCQQCICLRYQIYI